ncbi:MAG: helix-turn-helix transcriptional regulator [Halieaceae bacterium]|jgi:DNA-binding CsgD family transcriptional regulator|nr:helix-turn-helix transcriptional regulator [Halieaceae bacterium]
MSTLAQFSMHLASLIPVVGQPEFPAMLIRMLKQLVPIDDATILAYPPADLPIIEYFEVPTGSTHSNLGQFVKGAFLLDPYYLAATRDQKYGFFRLQALSPTGFKEGEYYKSWYRSCGYQDECGYLILLGGEGFINIALGKTGHSTFFTKPQIAILEAICPTIEILCQRHWLEFGAQSNPVNLRARMHAALDAFGSSLLTEREAQVINLVLHGHSTKSVAERLSISMETVKLHRKHAYAKLEIGSQAELFFLFLDSLMSANNYQGGDTLVAYLKPPQPRSEPDE